MFSLVSSKFLAMRIILCYTSYIIFLISGFGCLDCGCAVMGSDKGLCDEYTGKCQCKSGFSGDKCEICPDGSKTLLDGCPNSKYFISHRSIQITSKLCHIREKSRPNCSNRIFFFP